MIRFRWFHSSQKNANSPARSFRDPTLADSSGVRFDFACRHRGPSSRNFQLRSHSFRPTQHRQIFRRRYDFSVKYHLGNDNMPNLGSKIAAAARTWSEAAWKDLGLVFTKAKAPAEVLFIEHAEKPTPN